MSTAAKSLCMWARAMYTYDRVAKNIGPKKESLAQAEGDLAVVQSELAKKQEALQKVNNSERSKVRFLSRFWVQHDPNN